MQYSNIRVKFSQYSLHKKWSLPLRISSVNVTKSAGNCGFSTFTEEILNGKLQFLCSDRCVPNQEDIFLPVKIFSGILFFIDHFLIIKKSFFSWYFFFFFFDYVGLCVSFFFTHKILQRAEILKIESCIQMLTGNNQQWPCFLYSRWFFLRI